jgi:large subunit ribosomal protein L17
MRHKKLNKRFDRVRSARLALIRDLAIATLKFESINTTKVKAKEARRLVERLISLGKEGSLKSKRLAYRQLCNHSLVSLLFNDIALRFKNRSGGYTRVYSLLERRGDGSEQVILELSEKKKKEKIRKIKPEKKEAGKEEKVPPTTEEKTAKEEVLEEKEASSKKVAIEGDKKAKAEIEKKEKLNPEEKSAPFIKEKPKQREAKPPKKFLGGLRKLFKKERDSL